MVENNKISYDKNASFESLNEEQQIQSILDTLEAKQERKNNPIKHAVKDFVRKISSKKDVDKTPYDKSVSFESLNKEQQDQSILDMIEERKARRSHPAKFALKDFMNSATKNFKSGVGNKSDGDDRPPPSPPALKERHPSKSR